MAYIVGRIELIQATHTMMQISDRLFHMRLDYCSSLGTG
ncbi:hypothetical protein SAMN05892877_113133 [Rhizobium subbaraonis]|uniref:Uncharacterized protein n=1 Tax=Rhizobium subbaraonis TaxID=908946 RepID=A0A285USN6_9HYPH|nr:hypothetical protein SAMN05892877_113133 [Rhizobium subbaraonis]